MDELPKANGIDMLGGMNNGVVVEKADTHSPDNESLEFSTEVMISELLSHILGGADGVSPIPHDHETSEIVVFFVADDI